MTQGENRAISRPNREIGKTIRNKITGPSIPPNQATNRDNSSSRSLDNGHFIVVVNIVVLRPLTLKLSLVRTDGVGGVRQIYYGLVRVVFRGPTNPFDEVLHVVLNPPLVTYFLDLPLVLRVLQIGYSHEVIVVFTAAVVLKELDGKNVVEARVFSW